MSIAAQVEAARPRPGSSTRNDIQQQPFDELLPQPAPLSTSNFQQDSQQLRTTETGGTATVTKATADRKPRDLRRPAPADAPVPRQAPQSTSADKAQSGRREVAKADSAKDDAAKGDAEDDSAKSETTKTDATRADTGSTGVTPNPATADRNGAVSLPTTPQPSADAQERVATGTADATGAAQAIGSVTSAAVGTAIAADKSAAATKLTSDAPPTAQTAVKADIAKAPTATADAEKANGAKIEAFKTYKGQNDAARNAVAKADGAKIDGQKAGGTKADGAKTESAAEAATVAADDNAAGTSAATPRGGAASPDMLAAIAQAGKANAKAAAPEHQTKPADDTAAKTSQPADASKDGQTDAPTGAQSNADSAPARAPAKPPVPATLQAALADGAAFAAHSADRASVQPQNLAAAIPQLQAPAVAAGNAQTLPANVVQGAVPLAGLALEINAHAQAGSNRFEIRLDPPELGRIDVSLHVDAHGEVTSHLVVDRTDTLNLLQHNASDLQRALEQAGLKTGDSGLQFSLRDQSFGNAPGNDGGRPSAHVIVPDIEAPSAEVMARSYTRAGQGTGLDIRV